jgi:hypothetical protein
MKEQLFQKAIEIAQWYLWDTPDAVKLLKQHIVPKGFGREVGQTLALFLRPLIIIPLSKDEADQNRQIAKQLAELRLLIAQINILERSCPMSNTVKET